MPHLREVISHASLDEELFDLLRDAGHREAIRHALIGTYFPDFEGAIERLIRDERQIREYSRRPYEA